MVSLAVDLAPGNPRELRLASPIIAASGCFGFGTAYGGVVDLSSLGAFISPSVTLRARPIERNRRLIPAPAGVLYPDTHPNPGLRAFLRTYPKLWERMRVPALASIAGEMVEDFVELALRLEEVPGIAGLEINLTSTVREHAPYRFGDDPDLSGELVTEVRASTGLPLIAKLPADPIGTVAAARSVAAAGADAIALHPGTSALAIDVDRRRQRADLTLVGPATAPLAIRLMSELAGAVSVPLIGGGGIASLADALAYLMAGARAVQIGSSIFVDPQLPERIGRELAVWMESQGLNAIEDIVGAANVNARGDDEPQPGEGEPA